MPWALRSVAALAGEQVNGGASLLVQNQFTDRHEAGGVRGKRMTNFEFRISNELASFIRHSSFGIRHFPHPV
jgi:hypothetical protein